VWQNDGGQPNARLRVVITNLGRGDAEAVKVRFAKLGVDVYNETGNPAADIDDDVSPPRFSGGTRVPAPGESWAIAMLCDSHHAGWQPGIAPWSAQASNLVEQRGTVRVTFLPGLRRERNPAQVPCCQPLAGWEGTGRTSETGRELSMALRGRHCTKTRSEPFPRRPLQFPEGAARCS
jgi:hypothetical protein